MEDFLRRLQHLSEEESWPEEDVGEHDNTEKNENDDDDDFFNYVGIDYEGKEESEDYNEESGQSFETS